MDYVDSLYNSISLFMATGSLSLLFGGMFIGMFIGMFPFKVKAWLVENQANIFFMVATLGVVGSIIYSALLGLEPCRLCWYQRMILFPLPVLAGLAMYRKEFTNMVPYLKAFTLVGMVISLYQYLSQMLPGFAEYTKVATSCGLTGPDCSEISVLVFGFVTIPLMAFASFFFLFVWLQVFTKK